MYSVKEIFLTLQGEGAHAGRRAVFCRFAGCNLWSGREADRHAAICQFCDTDFVGTDGTQGGKFGDAEMLADVIAACWGEGQAHRYVVCTGGEPLLQIDATLIEALHARGFAIAIETNGTIAVPNGIDWVCMSPKRNAATIVTCGSELKLVYPQAGDDPARYAALEFDHYFLQPMDGPLRDENTQAAIAYCLQHPQWRLSLQTHKMTGMP
jgi:7-carboxy-7-deazaguanine synthase